MLRNASFFRFNGKIDLKKGTYYSLQRLSSTTPSGKLIKDTDIDSKTYKVDRKFAAISTESFFAKYFSLRIFNIFKMEKEQTSVNDLKVGIKPPETVRGMKKLDRDAFKCKALIPSIKVPLKSVGQLSKAMKKCLFKRMGIRPVANLNDDDTDKDNFKLFLFNPEMFNTVDSLTERERHALEKAGSDLKTWQQLEIELTFENWLHTEILKAVLPAESDGVAGFSQIGHIVHLNLRDELSEYKGIVGEVLLDKVHTAETVVNKINAIDNTFRNFKMEVVAGKDNFITQCKEHGCTFEFDFSKVYWNPRLGTEHQRIVAMLKSGDVVYDVFAGVGPFAVPAGKKKCIVLANDLNPESYKWLKHNITLNKVKSEMHSFNLDGRDFIKNQVKQDLLKRWEQNSEIDKYSMHIVMNLPALAVEFVDAFRGMLSDVPRESLKHIVLPKVHCYSFSKCDNPEEDVKAKVEEKLGCPLVEDYNVRIVRNVAPNKEMLCASFTLTEEILFDETCEPAEKKCKLQDS